MPSKPWPTLRTLEHVKDSGSACYIYRGYLTECAFLSHIYPYFAAVQHGQMLGIYLCNLAIDDIVHYLELVYKNCIW